MLLCLNYYSDICFHLFNFGSIASAHWRALTLIHNPTCNLVMYTGFIRPASILSILSDVTIIAWLRMRQQWVRLSKNMQIDRNARNNGDYTGLQSSPIRQVDLGR